MVVDILYRLNKMLRQTQLFNSRSYNYIGLWMKPLRKVQMRRLIMSKRRRLEKEVIKKSANLSFFHKYMMH